MKRFISREDIIKARQIKVRTRQAIAYTFQPKTEVPKRESVISKTERRTRGTFISGIYDSVFCKGEKKAESSG